MAGRAVNTRDLVVQVAQQLEDHVIECGKKHDAVSRALEENSAWIKRMLVLMVTGLAVGLWQLLIAKGFL